MDNGKHAYLPALDGIRALSILLVVVSHAWLGHIVPGGLGVTIFFFISGFIITRLMLAEWERAGRVDIKAFYIRRFFRLTPALVVYMLVSMLALIVAGVTIKWIEVAAVFFYFANYYDIFFGFGVGDPLQPFSITWSLAVEEHYYFFFPILFTLLIRNVRQFILVIVAALVLVLAWRLYLAIGIGLDHLPGSRIYKGTDTRVDSIFYGALFSIVLHYVKGASAFLARRAVFVSSALLLLLTLVVRDEVFRESVRYSIQGVAVGGLLYTAVFGNGLVNRVLASKPLVYVGKISYSLYLYHWLVLGLVSAYMPTQARPLQVATLFIASFVAAHLSYKFVEMPGLRLRGRFIAWLGMSRSKAAGG